MQSLTYLCDVGNNKQSAKRMEIHSNGERKQKERASEREKWKGKDGRKREIDTLEVLIHQKYATK